jgi:hypothetical protein
MMFFNPSLPHLSCTLNYSLTLSEPAFIRVPNKPPGSTSKRTCAVQFADNKCKKAKVFRIEGLRLSIRISTGRGDPVCDVSSFRFISMRNMQSSLVLGWVVHWHLTAERGAALLDYNLMATATISSPMLEFLC